MTSSANFAVTIVTGAMLWQLSQSTPVVQKRRKSKADEVWLSDLIDYDYMADAPDAGSDFCPPVPSTLPKGSCDMNPCSSDRACAKWHESGKCCYNGCVYTCLFQVGPPGFFDWSKAPRSRLSSGRSWLVDGPESVNEVESCSTTPVESDEDPLLCPHGYVCSVEDPGDAKNGIPNRGRCVKESDETEMESDDLEERTTLRPLLQLLQRPLACQMNDLLILEGARFQKGGRHCQCKRGKLVCKRKSKKGKQ